ncbi:MAG TPA: hypothetical protein VLF67_01725 [Candidatus Saccharimonas sp.]|nr:hypothetical protein [Candidatus Saccharimonas sp.]
MANVPTTEGGTTRHARKGKWLTLPELCREVGAGRSWVERRARAYCASEVRFDAHGPFPGFRECWPPRCLKALQRARKRIQSVPELGTMYVTLVQAADLLGASRQWITETIAANPQLPPICRRRRPEGRIVQAVSRATVKKLGQLRQQIAPEGWISLAEVRRRTRWANDTIIKRLGAMGIEPAIYISSLNGQPGYHYHESVCGLLGIRPHRQPGGDWRTVHGLSVALGRSEHWVRHRLHQVRGTEAAEFRLDDSRIQRLHYPPLVYQQLRAMSDAQGRPAQGPAATKAA